MPFDCFSITSLETFDRPHLLISLSRLLPESFTRAWLKMLSCGGAFRICLADSDFEGTAGSRFLARN